MNLVDFKYFNGEISKGITSEIVAANYGLGLIG
jgi:hypothetical protein